MRPKVIGGSDAARAVGVSEEGQALDVYLEKRGEIEPFEGNDFTERGKRFEPFIALEYTAQTGHEIETNLPMYFHPQRPWQAATPDGRWVKDELFGVEFKACGWHRARLLGDEPFDDWLIQCQHNMGVMGMVQMDLFVMVDLHSYRLFEIHRDDEMIEDITKVEAELMRRIQQGDPPVANMEHPAAVSLAQRAFKRDDSQVVQLGQWEAEAWRDYKVLGEQINDLNTKRDSRKAVILFGLRDAARGRLPLGKKELRRVEIKRKDGTTFERIYERKV